jgi:Arc/MetJ family transcription regulator
MDTALIDKTLSIDEEAFTEAAAFYQTTNPSDTINAALRDAAAGRRLALLNPHFKGTEWEGTHVAANWDTRPPTGNREERRAALDALHEMALNGDFDHLRDRKGFRR